MLECFCQSGKEPRPLSFGGQCRPAHRLLGKVMPLNVTAGVAPQRLLVGTLLCNIQWNNRKFTLELKQSLREMEIIGTQFWDFLSFSHALWTMTNTLRAKNIPFALMDVYNSVFQINKFYDLTDFVASIHLPENKSKQEEKAMLLGWTLKTHPNKMINAFEYKEWQSSFFFFRRNHCLNLVP